MLLDTSVIVELLGKPRSDPLVKRILAAVGDDILFASPIHMGEIADVARRSGLQVQDVVDRALQIVQLIPLDAAIAVQASEIKAEARKRKAGKDFSLIDGVGLASARSRGMKMLTLDPEFEGLDGVVVLRRSARAVD